MGGLRCDSFIFADVSPKGNHNDNASFDKIYFFTLGKVGMVLTFFFEVTPFIRDTCSLMPFGYVTSFVKVLSPSMDCL